MRSARISHEMRNDQVKKGNVKSTEYNAKGELVKYEKVHTSCSSCNLNEYTVWAKQVYLLHPDQRTCIDASAEELLYQRLATSRKQHLSQKQQC